MGVESQLAAAVLKLLANWACLWLWGLALWFFFVSLVANLVCLRKKNQMPFSMSWFSFIFPQTALVTATFRLAEAFDAQAIRVLACVMSIILAIVWALVVIMMVRAILKKHILWPEKGEDKIEGGFGWSKSNKVEGTSADPEKGAVPRNVRQNQT